MDRLNIIIDAIPPSLNKYLGNSHNFNVYRHEKEAWQWRLYAALPPEGRTKPRWKRSRVSITYFFPDNIRRDPDNYSGKFIMDGLKAAGIIADDSFKNIELRLAGVVDSKRPRTEIEVECLTK